MAENTGAGGWVDQVLGQMSGEKLETLGDDDRVFIAAIQERRKTGDRTLTAVETARISGAAEKLGIRRGAG